MTVSTDLMFKLLRAKKVLTNEKSGSTDDAIDNELETKDIIPSFPPKPLRSPSMADVLANCLAPSAGKDNTPLK